jgi:uncharacterized protein
VVDRGPVGCACWRCKTRPCASGRVSWTVNWATLIGISRTARRSRATGGAQGESTLTLAVVGRDKPAEGNLILGQSPVIKTVEDLHEALVTHVPGIKFGLAFCEASGPRLVQRASPDPALPDRATQHAQAIGAGHPCIILLGNAFPLNVLNAIQAVPEGCGIFGATAKPVQGVVAQTEPGRGILGVIDGQSPVGVEDDAAARQHKPFLRTIGDKQ